MLGGALPMMRRMGGAFFGAQLGQALGALAREVVGGGDIGLPLLPAGRAALLPANVAAFGAGLGLPEDEVRLYLALREAAHARLFAGVPWLRAHLLGAVEEYARGHRHRHRRRSRRRSATIDPSDPQALQEALSSGLFEPETHAAAAGRARPAGDRARARRGLGRRGRGRGRRGVAAARATRCARPSAAGAPPAARPSTPSPRSSASSCGRAGCARRPRSGRR